MLVFYPFAFSGVCSAELAALRDDFPEAARPDVTLLAVSADTTFSLRTWADDRWFRIPDVVRFLAARRGREVLWCLR